MSLIELVVLALALAMDAVAVSIAMGAKCKNYSARYAIVSPSIFGVFQGVMPFIGFLAGAAFASYIESFDHYIVLIVLGGLGVKMIYESLNQDELEGESCDISYKSIFAMGVATSIDALAVGLTFALLKIDVLTACAIIALITAILSSLAVYIGIRLGTALESKAEILGGVILIAIGVKIFLQHVG